MKFVILAVLLAQAVVPPSDEAPLVPLGNIAGLQQRWEELHAACRSYLMIRLRVGMLAMRAMLLV
jgi:hypothetical protein